jgi:hypothetical protein
MFTITNIREGSCDECHTIGIGVEFVLKQDPGAKAFLCWKQFRMTREAMCVANKLPVGGNESSQVRVHGVTSAPQSACRNRC